MKGTYTATYVLRHHTSVNIYFMVKHLPKYGFGRYRLLSPLNIGLEHWVLAMCSPWC